MDVEKAIKKRRAYRILEKIEITDEMLNKIIEAARLAPSCFNKQPWRFLFVRNPEKLEKFKQVFSEGNEWAYDASMLAIVFSKKEDDCIVKNRKYYLFDTGLAVGQMLLQATEMGLLTHPIAGFSPKKIRNLTDIPEDYKIITVIIFGKHPTKAKEEKRPARLKFSEFCYWEKYSK
ncbi:MAG: nitroreductase family protein [Candidatus Cloacimonadota bacterium]|nr:nitroreductase family protein [Candidatus Cloacimonadota bacterium]